MTDSCRISQTLLAVFDVGAGTAPCVAHATSAWCYPIVPDFFRTHAISSVPSPGGRLQSVAIVDTVEDAHAILAGLSQQPAVPGAPPLRIWWVPELHFVVASPRTVLRVAIHSRTLTSALPCVPGLCVGGGTTRPRAQS